VSATFPILKTAAVAQYPARRTVRYQNQVLRFIDGGEQRYRDCAGPLHRWEIRLAQLDEAELAALAAFLETSQGAFGSFAFTDPWDGAAYPDCSLAADDLALTLAGVMSGSASLVVMENRK
jgi:hypothetical protein